MVRWCNIVLLLVPTLCLANEWSGHIKYQGGQFWFDDNSIATQLGYPHPNAHSLDFRLNLKGNKSAWRYAVHYQVQTTGGRQHRFQQDLQAILPNVSFNSFEDDQRLLDLSHTLLTDRNISLQHRLDRLWLSYAKENIVVKIGRQALSWGNGLVFQPLDVIAPFAPASVNTDYKTGDDMLYGQWLFDNGADMQAAIIPRRRQDRVKMAASSIGIKYRASLKALNYDILIGQHYDEFISGLGLVRALGQAQWRLDILNAHTKQGNNYFSAMSNVDYSWNWWQNNFYGFVEYYFNELGQDKVNLATVSPHLAQRLVRGEVFTYGKHYLSAGLNIELHALVRFTPSLITNVSDGSSRLLLRGQYDWKQSLSLDGGLNFSLGGEGTEYGGLRIPAMGTTTFSTGQWFYVQLSYFY